jgi:hypothetical protein
MGSGFTKLKYTKGGGLPGMKLQLPSVTLLCVDCVDIIRTVHIVEHCKQKADFGAVKLLTSIETDYEHAVKVPALNSLIAYSIFMLTKCHEYIDTDRVLIIQRDGWILNPESFDPAWLELDYIGPLFVQYDKVGSGGFSLRSKKIMQEAAKLLPEWDWSDQQAHDIQAILSYYEDGVICLGQFAKRFKIATPRQACQFAQGGNRNPDYFHIRPFGFHRTWQEIDFKTGIVDSSDGSKDLHVSYDWAIDQLM